MRNKILVMLLVFALVFTTAACGSKPASNDASDQETKERTFAVVFPIVHPFFEPIGVAAEDYGKELGIKVITKAPDKSDAQQQIEIMENLIAMKVDGIAIGPTDTSALVPTINKAVEAGIKVICFESDAPDSNKAAFIGTNNYNAGRHMGAVITEKLGGEGKILILTGLPTQLSLNERIRGIKEYLAEKSPNIVIADTQSSEGDPQKAVTAAENMMQANQDFKAMIGIDATAGPAMISVWKAKGWQNSTDQMIITFDDMADNLQGLRDGYVTGIVSQRQNSWGKSVIDMLNDLCDGKSVESYVDTGTIEITQANIDTYLDEPSYVEQ
ncbi:MAG TPA: substrate-binding domain-containing protein [Anaerovoracaceae bacterium]|nr:substrate-binding domain-containing protein [Anaerovoracaceae bacterium]